MTETATIVAVGHGGDGVAESAEGRFFVPFTLPGETVTIEHAGERAGLVSVDHPSSERVAPICIHFGACGGCALQHWSASPYLAWKRDQVVAALAQRGIEAPIRPVIGIQAGGRRRAVFTALRLKTRLVLGFARRASTEILPVTECAVMAPPIVAALPMLRELAMQAVPVGERQHLTVTLADNGLDIDLAGESPAPRLLAALTAFAAGATIARLTVGGETVFQTGVPELRVGGGMLYPTPGGFLQAVGAAEAALADAVAAAIGEEGPVADLFAGIGTFTLGVARYAPVLAMDSDADALVALERAARAAKGLKAVTVRRRDLMRNPPSPAELAGFASVVFDPPRTGARRLVEQLALSEVARIAAVSCNPATFARDARTLMDGGYRLLWVQPVDQFLFSPHIELAAAFARTT